jgi:hypothetical protein
LIDETVLLISCAVDVNCCFVLFKVFSTLFEYTSRTAFNQLLNDSLTVSESSAKLSFNIQDSVEISCASCQVAHHQKLTSQIVFISQILIHVKSSICDVSRLILSIIQFIIFTTELTAHSAILIAQFFTSLRSAENILHIIQMISQTDFQYAFK